MGFLDDAVGSAVPQGNVSKPLMIALGALLASGVLFKNAGSGVQPSKPATSQPSGQGNDLAGALGGLLNQFQQSGLGNVMKSWIGTARTSRFLQTSLARRLDQRSFKFWPRKPVCPNRNSRPNSLRSFPEL